MKLDQIGSYTTSKATEIVQYKIHNQAHTPSLKEVVKKTTEHLKTPKTFCQIST